MYMCVCVNKGKYVYTKHIKVSWFCLEVYPQVYVFKCMPLQGFKRSQARPTLAPKAMKPST